LSSFRQICTFLLLLLLVVVFVFFFFFDRDSVLLALDL
jgi:hypothetical protein